MSYNIRNGIGIDEINNLNRTVEVITNANPDIVAVQEVDSVTQRSNGTYILGELAKATGMTDIYAPAIDFDGGKYGIGILSREMPLSVNTVALPGTEEKRMLLIAEFKDYIFCCTHLSLTEEDCNASASILTSIVDKTTKPIFLAGDFNSHPDDSIFRTLSSKYSRISDGVTPTFPADNPIEVIDYILLANGNNVMPIKSEVINAPVASDHRPIVVTVGIMVE